MTGFSLHVDHRLLDATAPVLRSEESAAAGRTHTAIVHQAPGARLHVIQHTVRYADTGLTEHWISVANRDSRAVELTMVSSVVLDLPAVRYELLQWESGWGAEFAPTRSVLAGDEVIGVTAGRSSRTRHPLIVLEHAGEATLAVSVMWSGNWQLRFQTRPAGGLTLSGGLHPDGFAKTLEAGEDFESPHVAVAVGDGGLDDLAHQFTVVGRRHWYPRSDRLVALPTEWNHWWSYEDTHLNEQTFRRNVDVAKRIGLELCTLDAGWFGPAGPDSHWVDYRGDWNRVNSERFPSGIRALADYVHGAGMLFGIWCEIEAVGPRSSLCQEHPDFLATRHGDRLGYVCLGNPAVREWAFATLERLLTDHDADWIKLDFNLDPGLGCDRTDHGHGAGDGLYEHYRGYYATLDRLRAAHPAAILENCASGGLRIDLEMLRHTDLTFLSDPDWPEHGLQLLWGAMTMLAPDRLLHWGWSEWMGSYERQTLNLRDPNLSPRRLTYYRRIAMLGATGCSFRLPDLPRWVERTLTEQTEFYKAVVRPFVRNAETWRLTGQPQRDGKGDRWAGFQYSLSDTDRHLVFVFRLTGGEPARTLRLNHMNSATEYTVRRLDAGSEEYRTGLGLMRDGLRFDDLPEEESEVLMVEPRGLPHRVADGGPHDEPRRTLT